MSDRITRRRFTITRGLREDAFGFDDTDPIKVFVPVFFPGKHGGTTRHADKIAQPLPHGAIGIELTGGIAGDHRDGASPQGVEVSAFHAEQVLSLEMNRAAEALHLRSRCAHDEPGEEGTPAPGLAGEDDDFAGVQSERDSAQPDAPVTEPGGTLDSETSDLK